MAKTQKYDEDQLLDAVVKYAEIERKKIKATELAKWCRNNIEGLEEVRDYHFTRPIREKVSAKYCYAAHESRLHQNDRCKRFALCLVLTVRFRSLAPWGKLFQLFI